MTERFFIMLSKELILPQQERGEESSAILCSAWRIFLGCSKHGARDGSLGKLE
jgi:hypothetical protein